MPGPEKIVCELPLPLFDQLLSDDAAEANAAEATAHAWLNRIRPDRLPAADIAIRDALRSHASSRGWAKLQAGDLPLRFGEQLRHAAMFFASMHPSGYVRERALRTFPPGRPELALAAALLRLNDPTPQIRKAGEALLAQRLPEADAAVSAHLLPLITALERAKRVGPSDWFTRFARVLLSEPDLAQLRCGLAHPACPVSGAFFRVVEGLSWPESESLLTSVMRESVPTLRRRALIAIRTQAPTADRLRLLPAFLHHHSPAVRAFALEAVLADCDASNAHRILLEAITDRSAWVRGTALCFLQKTSLRESLLAQSRDALRHDSAPVESERAIRIIAAFGDSGDAPGVKLFLASPVAAVRIAALDLLAKHGGPPAREDLIRALADPVPAVANAAARLLAKCTVAPYQAELMRLARSPAARTRHHALRLLARTPRWTAMPFLLEEIATTPGAALPALRVIELWMTRADSGYHRPTPTERAETERALAAHGAALPVALREKIRAALVC